MGIIYASIGFAALSIFFIFLAIIINVRSKKSVIAKTEEPDFIDKFAEKKKLKLKQIPGAMKFQTYVLLLCLFPVIIALVLWIILKNVWIALAASLVGLFIPEILVRLTENNHKKKFEERYARALRQLSSSLRAGMTIQQAVMDLCTCPFIHYEIKKEFKKIDSEIKLGISVTEAFEHMADRVPTVDVKDVATAVKIDWRFDLPADTLCVSIFALNDESYYSYLALSRSQVKFLKLDNESEWRDWRCNTSVINELYTAAFQLYRSKFAYYSEEMFKAIMAESILIRDEEKYNSLKKSSDKQISQLKTDVLKYKNGIKTEKKRIGELENQLKQYDKKKVESLENQNAELRAENKNLESQMAEKDVLISTFESKKSKYKNRIASLESAIDKILKLNDELERKLEEQGVQDSLLVVEENTESVDQSSINYEDYKDIATDANLIFCIPHFAKNELLREYFPNSKFIRMEEDSCVDIGSATDGVIICTAHCKHATYRQIMAQIVRYDLKYAIVNSYGIKTMFTAGIELLQE